MELLLGFLWTGTTAPTAIPVVVSVSNGDDWNCGLIYPHTSVPIKVRRNPGFPQDILKRCARTSITNKGRCLNTVTNSKYPTKYRGNFCPSIGSTGVIFLFYQMSLSFPYCRFFFTGGGSSGYKKLF